MEVLQRKGGSQQKMHLNGSGNILTISSFAEVLREAIPVVNTSWYKSTLVSLYINNIGGDNSCEGRWFL